MGDGAHLCEVNAMGRTYLSDCESAGAYGSRLSETFRVYDAPTFINRNLQHGLLAITEIRDDEPETRASDPPPREDAFLVTFHPKAFHKSETWEAGRSLPAYDIPAGTTMIYDLKRSPSILINQPHHSLHFYIPRESLDLICDDAEAERVGDLRHDRGVPLDDDVIRNIAGAVLAMLRTPAEANRMFLDHITMAMGTHVAQLYGGFAPGSRIARGGLSPRQERRAKEMIESSLEGAVSIEAVAEACGLSASHFRRAFRQSTGSAPHQWLLQRRVCAAREALLDAGLTLPEIARRCGFADQSHFTRVFSQVEGISPARWRRNRDVRIAEQP